MMIRRDGKDNNHQKINPELNKYKAQAEKGSADAKNPNSQESQKAEKSGDDVQDVDFEEVKD